MITRLNLERKKWEEQNKEFFILQTRLESKEKEVSKLESSSVTLEGELRNTREKLIIQETINKSNEIKLQEQKKEILEINLKLNEGFKNIANDILEEKSKKFTEMNQQNLNSIISPLTEKIKEFGNKVQETFEKDIAESASVRQQIQTLSELNKKMSDEAHHLSSALRGSNKVQGDWGKFSLQLFSNFPDLLKIRTIPFRKT